MKDQNENHHQQGGKMSRRDFMGTTAAAAVAISTAASAVQAANPSKKFKLKYGPPLGMFRQQAGKAQVYGRSGFQRDVR